MGRGGTLQSLSGSGSRGTERRSRGAPKHLFSCRDLLTTLQRENTSAREWHLGFGCGSKGAEEEELGLMPYFRVLAVPATPQHNEVTITSVREAFSNSSTAS